MAPAEARKRAGAKYQKEEACKMLPCFYPAETDLYECVRPQGNASGCIKRLVREDMERNAK